MLLAAGGVQWPEDIPGFPLGGSVREPIWALLMPVPAVTRIAGAAMDGVCETAG